MSAEGHDSDTTQVLCDSFLDAEMISFVPTRHLSYTDEPTYALGTYCVEVDNPQRFRVQVSAKLDVHGLFSLSDPVLSPQAIGEKPETLKMTRSDVPGCSDAKLGGTILLGGGDCLIIMMCISEVKTKS